MIKPVETFYFKCNDGIGGAKTNSWDIRAALNTTQEFVECTKEEYQEAIRRARLEEEKEVGKEGGA